MEMSIIVSIPLRFDKRSDSWKQVLIQYLTWLSFNSSGSISVPTSMERSHCPGSEMFQFLSGSISVPTFREGKNRTGFILFQFLSGSISVPTRCYWKQ